MEIKTKSPSITAWAHSSAERRAEYAMQEEPHPRHERLASQLHTLAKLKMGRGDLREAERCGRRALALLDRTRGAQDSSSLSCLGQLVQITSELASTLTGDEQAAKLEGLWPLMRRAATALETPLDGNLEPSTPRREVSMLLEDALGDAEEAHGPAPLSEEDQRAADQERYTRELVEEDAGEEAKARSFEGYSSNKDPGGEVMKMELVNRYARPGIMAGAAYSELSDGEVGHLTREDYSKAYEEMVIRFEALELPPGLTAEDMAYVSTAGEDLNYASGWEEGWSYARDAAATALSHAESYGSAWKSDPSTYRSREENPGALGDGGGSSSRAGSEMLRPPPRYRAPPTVLSVAAGTLPRPKKSGSGPGTFPAATALSTIKRAPRAAMGLESRSYVAGAPRLESPGPIYAADPGKFHRRFKSIFHAFIPTGEARPSLRGKEADRLPAPNAYDPPQEHVTHTRPGCATIGTAARKGVVRESYCSELYAVTMKQIQVGRGFKKATNPVH